MAEYIGCRNCDSFYCDNCNIYILATMLNEGKLDCLMDERHCITTDPMSYISGYCEDAFQKSSPQVKIRKPKKTGRAYRRHMRRHKDAKLMEMMTWGYNPAMGYTDWDWVDGTYKPTGNHIKYPKSSRMQKYWKKQSNRHVRRYKGGISKGNSYRKHFEYVYKIF